MSTDLDFDRWVQHLLNHPVADPPWYFQLDQGKWEGLDLASEACRESALHGLGIGI